MKITRIHSSSFGAEIHTYAQLQREIHNALLAQHPEWILPNGECPTCQSYDARFAELLIQTLPMRSRGLKQANTHRFQYPDPSRVSTDAYRQ